MLEPPGGRSSICLGGGTFDDYSAPRKQSNKENNYIGSQKQTQAPSVYKRTSNEVYENALSSALPPNKKPEPIRRMSDSLDYMIESTVESRSGRYIPGLENHPTGLRSSNQKEMRSDSYSGRNDRDNTSPYQSESRPSGSRSTMSKQEYAAILRDQINDNKKLARDSEDRENSYDSASYRSKGSHKLALRNPPPVSTSRQAYGNSSTNFLNWDNA